MPNVAQLSELQKFLAAYAVAAPPTSEERAARQSKPDPEPIAVSEPEPPSAPVDDYDDLEAEEVISLLGSLEGKDLVALRAYEESAQNRAAILRAIDGVLARREPAGTH
jgi:hypothetical protein